MKTVMPVFVMILFSGIAFSQSFEKRNFIRPEYEKTFASKVDIVKAARNKYFNNRFIIKQLTLERWWDRNRNTIHTRHV